MKSKTQKKSTKSSLDVKKYVQDSRKEFYTSTYPLTLRAIKDMYERDAFELNPDFQRMFRWNDEQKTRFIESILLDIPIPSLFFYQADDGRLQVVDGLQRISTWLEFVGILKDEDGNKKDAFVLGSMSILKDLKGRVWKDDSSPNKDIGNALRLILEDQSITAQVIKNESDANAKFEVFRRINSGGAFLSKQELRNAMLVLLNKGFLEWIDSLSLYEPFLNSTSLSERLGDERYDLELILKFFVLYEFGWEREKNVSEYIDEKTYEFALRDKKGKFDREKMQELFEEVFSFINNIFSDGAFKKFQKNKFSGKFLESAYELVILVALYNYDKLDNAAYEKIFKDNIIESWKNEAFLSIVGSGSNAKSRIPNVIKYVEQNLVR